MDCYSLAGTIALAAMALALFVLLLGGTLLLLFWAGTKMGL
jgi:hypothetical protein